VGLAVLYGGLMVLVYAFQERFLYHPNLFGGGLDATPALLGFDYEDVHVTTDDGVRLHGWYVPGAGSRGVALHFHGNGGNISHRLAAIPMLHSLGLDAFLVDYRGYGLSEGRPSEAGTYLDAQAAWRYLVDERGRAPGEVVVFGYSLGAAIAAHLARAVQPAALVMEAPFTSARAVASHHYWFLPVGLLLRFEYPTARFVSQVDSPVLVLHSPDDEIVPFAQGRAVYEAAPGPKAFAQITGRHAEGPSGDRERYTKALRWFLDSHVFQ
jgi:uncharacterized protein